MSEFIDRVAQALWEQYATTPRSWEQAKDYEKEKLRADARAAIAAMRDPSQGMRMAGHDALVGSEFVRRDLGGSIGYAALGDAWRAMIDDALSRSP